MIRRSFFGILCFLPFVHSFHGQVVFFGVRGLCSIGSHEQRFGLGWQVSFSFEKVLLSAGNDASFYLSALGGRKSMWESRAHLGASWFVNDQQGVGDFEFGTLRNPFSRSSNLGYAYLWYWDNKTTRQSSAAFRVEYQGHSVYFENDFFAGKGKDRFRTASLQYRYRNDFWAVHSGLVLWTGETAGVQVQTQNIKDKSIYFKDLSSMAYGTTSHGLIFGGIRYGLVGQTLGFDIGLDSERIRNAFQNQWAHHVLWHRKNPKAAVIYPMLDGEGNPTWDIQKIRPSTPYFRISLSGD